MPKFLSGFAIGVFTGWLFHDTIDRNLRKAVETAQEKAEEKIDDIEVKKAAPESAYPLKELTPERIEEINNATLENPVEVTYAEMVQMPDQIAVKIALGKGELYFAARA